MLQATNENYTVAVVFYALLPRLNTDRSLAGLCTNPQARQLAAVFWSVFVASLLSIVGLHLMLVKSGKLSRSVSGQWGSTRAKNAYDR